jgi:hypothetical protein
MGGGFFVAGFTSGGAPYGIFEDEIEQMEPGHLDEDEREPGNFRAVNDGCPF